MSLKQLRLSLDAISDPRVLALAEITGHTHHECLGVAITIWSSAAAEAEVHMPEWISQEMLEQAGLADGRVPASYSHPAKYMRAYRAKKRKV